VTVDVYAPFEESPVEAALADLLDREWQAQSARMAPLAMTSTVRESIELVCADSPYGIFAVAGELSHPAVSPGELLERLHDRLPAAISPWTARTLRRVGSLRPTEPLLAAPAAPPALEPPALEVPPAPVDPAPPEVPEAPAAPEPRRPWRMPSAIAAAGASGALAGLPLGVPAGALHLANAPFGALVGALAAALGAGVAWRARGGSAER